MSVPKPTETHGTSPGPPVSLPVVASASDSWTKDKRPDRRNAGALLALSLLLVVYGLVSSPLPGVNETHYLGKARHFHDPAWCAADLFLQSGDAHVVFFMAFGGFPAGIGFAAAALLVRTAGCAVVAWGWLRLSRAFGLSNFAGTVALMLGLYGITLQRFSGEWIIGGGESKTFAYGCLFAAWAAFLEDRRLNVVTALLWSIAWHPVVGGWGMLTILAASTVRIVQDWREGRSRTSSIGHSPITRIDLLRLGLALIVAGIALAWVVSLLREKVPLKIAFDANYLQVFYRLAHHLDPMRFGTAAWSRWLAVLIFWSGCVALSRRRLPNGWGVIVLAAAVFAIVGGMIGYRWEPITFSPMWQLRMTLLKFYPFRLADALIPLVASLSLVGALTSRPRLPRFAGYGVGATVVAAVLIAVSGPLFPTVAERQKDADWIVACTWIRDHTPPDALCLTPHIRSTFKWYAQRPEYVAFKDCPQDAKGIVEWNRRLLWLRDWFSRQYIDQKFDAAELRRLHAESGIDYLVTDHLGPIEVAPIFQNATYRIYDLTNAVPELAR